MFRSKLYHKCLLDVSLAVCWAWHDSATEILEDLVLRGIPRRHDQACLTAFRRTPKSLSNLGLGLMVIHNQEMTRLFAPEDQETLLDLAIVGKPTWMVIKMEEVADIRDSLRFIREMRQCPNHLARYFG